MKTASILGVHFHAVTMQQAVALAMSRLRARQKGYVVTPNPEIVDLCRRDSEYMGIVNHAALVLPDGVGIIYAAKILGEELYGRVPGIEFGEHLVAAMAKENMRLYLLGAKPGIAEQAGANLCEKYPGLVLAGRRQSMRSMAAAGRMLYSCALVRPNRKNSLSKIWMKSMRRCFAGLAARWMYLRAFPSARRKFLSSSGWNGCTACSSSPAASGA